MKIIKFGDITTVESGIIVHCTNCQHIMRSGVAKTLRQKWPEVFDAYHKAYEAGDGKQFNKLTLGDVSFAYITPISDRIDTDKWVANLNGQEFYGREPGRVYVDYDALRKGFKLIADRVSRMYWEPMIHYPQIGAGLAGGDWNIIEKIIDEELKDLDHTLWMFQP